MLIIQKQLRRRGYALPVFVSELPVKVLDPPCYLSVADFSELTLSGCDKKNIPKGGRKILVKAFCVEDINMKGRCGEAHP
jgi:hypothetical protein